MGLMLLFVQLLLFFLQMNCVFNKKLDDKLYGFSVWGCIPIVFLAFVINLL